MNFMKTENCVSLKLAVFSEHYSQFNFDALQNIFGKNTQMKNKNKLNVKVNAFYIINVINRV